jgi:hypothetical protein
MVVLTNKMPTEIAHGSSTEFKETASSPCTAGWVATAHVYHNHGAHFARLDCGIESVHISLVLIVASVLIDTKHIQPHSCLIEEIFLRNMQENCLQELGEGALRMAG